MNAAMVKMWVPGWLRPAPDSMVAGIARSGFRPKLQALNLLWSVWVFCAPIFMPVGPAYFWSLLIGYPVFLLLFALVHVRPYAETAYYVCALVLLASVSMPFNPAAWSYGVFACVYVPYHGSRLSSFMWLAAVELLLLAIGFWLGWPWQMLLILLGVCTSAGLGALVGRINAMKNTAERMSRDEVRRLAANAERERIGRDLHDLLGHTLSLITLKLELSRKLFDRDPDRAQRELCEAEKVARHALSEVRAAVTGIRATGLAGELASARLMLGTSGVVLDAGTMPSLPDAVDDTLALVLRESVTNIHRHAQASHASVTAEVVDGHVMMHVRDDGRGGVGMSGNGLSGMRERIEARAGSLRIHSSPGEGTELCIDIPLSVPDKSVPTSERKGHKPMQTDTTSFPQQAGGHS